MKRAISILLCLVLLLSFAACGAKPDEPEEETTVIEVTEPEITEEETEDETTAPEGVKDAYYYAELYGTNVCPFYINYSGTEIKYFFRNGGYLEDWVYTENNVDGWYYFDGMVISRDGKYAVGPETDAFSSFCTYEAQPYNGETLTEEQQKEIIDGVLYVVNSYTPIDTVWGIALTDDAEDEKRLSCRDIECGFDKDDTINVFTQFRLDNDVPCNAGLFVFPHQDAAVYTGDMTDELRAGAALETSLANPDSNDIPCASINIPADAVDASEDGRFDLVFTYDDIIVAYTVITVEKQ